jgi:hypothetical protein
MPAIAAVEPSPPTGQGMPLIQQPASVAEQQPVVEVPRRLDRRRHALGKGKRPIARLVTPPLWRGSSCHRQCESGCREQQPGTLQHK